MNMNMNSQELKLIVSAAINELCPTDPGQRGKAASISKTSGVPPQAITDMRSGRSPGSEERRRAVAAALGLTYEQFLDVGRKKYDETVNLWLTLYDRSVQRIHATRTWRLTGPARGQRSGRANATQAREGHRSGEGADD